MRISTTEVRLRRLLAAVPHQKNKRKLIHHVATLKKVLHTLNNETAEPSLSDSIDSRTEYYSRCIQELSHQVNDTNEVDDIGMDDVWNSILQEEASEVSSRSGQPSVFDGEQLSPGSSTSDFSLFPSCLKRKYSPDMGMLPDLEFTESGLSNQTNTTYDYLGKRICLDLEEHQARVSEKPMPLNPEREQVGKLKEDYNEENVSHRVDGLKHLEQELQNARKSTKVGEDVAETSCASELLENEVGISGTVSSEEGKDEVEYLDDEARFHIRQQRDDQEKMVEEMLILTNQIKEGSLLLGSSLHQTAVLLSSSELSLRNCLSATTSAQMKTGELLTLTQERECGCATWFSLLLIWYPRQSEDGEHRQYQTGVTAFRSYDFSTNLRFFS
ncbi:hypothetical protein R1flu_022685 [Riccia fluitans]|uniref:Uncharacterized protein n=1 Tax=Riccia fluitans TaxID=41844 RepID=A0ABD1XTY7_9MARC